MKMLSILRNTTISRPLWASRTLRLVLVVSEVGCVMFVMTGELGVILQCNCP